MVPLTIAMVGYLYQSNARLIVESSQDIMRRSTAAMSRDVQGLIAPIAGLVQSSAEIVRADDPEDGAGCAGRAMDVHPQLNQPRDDGIDLRLGGAFFHDDYHDFLSRRPGARSPRV
jgi:hypothetical protein